MTPATPGTVAELIDYGCSRFEQSDLYFGHGSDNAFDEAIHLVLFVLAIDPDDLNTHLHDAVAPADRSAVLDLFQRRIQERQPAAYLTGIAWLHGLQFHCDARALVPRSLLVEAMTEALPDWMQTVMSDPPEATNDGWPASILDLCCGSGSIAIHAARWFEGATVVASDLSEDALSLCRKNLSRHRLTDQIRPVQSDGFAALRGDAFDLILCNPPYVNSESMRTLPAEYLAEPELALHGGDDGMDLITQILHDAPQHMNPQAVLLLEIGHEAEGFEARFNQLEFSYLAVEAGDQMVVALTREQLSGVIR